MRAALSKTDIIRRLKRATEAEDLFPGVLGNPVTFAARWGQPLSTRYLKSKDQELRAAKQGHRAPAARRDGDGRGQAATRRRQASAA